MYIAYIYSPDWTIITQIQEITNLNISLKLNNIGDASFDISSKNIANTYDILQEFNKVRISKQLWNTENIMFEGYIRLVVAGVWKTSVYIWDYNRFFQSKFVNSEKNYTGQSYNFILSDIIWEINARFATWISLDCWILDTTPDKKYTEGTDFLKILKDLAWSKYEFKIANWVLYFKETIWLDRSISWDDYVIYTYNIDDYSSNNISNPETSYNAENIANNIKVKWDSYSYANDTVSIAKYWSVERIFTNSWQDTETANNILLQRKTWTREISFIPIVKDFFEVWIWDTVAIYIKTENSLNYYNWNAKILEKNYKSSWLEQISIKVSTSKISTLDFLWKIKDLDSRIKTIEL